MTTPIPNNDPEAMLAAFADGELDGEQNLRVLRRLAEDPGLAQRVADHQRLRGAVAKAMDSRAQAPAELRGRIAELAKTVPAEADPLVSRPRTEARPPASPVLARIGRWMPAAVAAMFFVAALLALNLTGGPDSPGDRLIAQANLLNASLVEQFGDRHFKCSRDIIPLVGTDRFPQNLAELPGALSDYFDQPVDPEVLDLSSLGYTFDVAGMCIVPGKGAVHMVYKSQASTGQTDTLSLWMRPFEEGSGIEPDRLYTTTPSQETFPMVVWRHGDMVYYLVGDTYGTVQRAFQAISRGQG